MRFYGNCERWGNRRDRRWREHAGSDWNRTGNNDDGDRTVRRDRRNNQQMDDQQQ